MQEFDINTAKSLYRPRVQDSYKGDYGHVLMAVGSAGMCGAAILSSRACLHAGTGLVSVWSEEICRNPLQCAVPEAMFMAASGAVGKFSAPDFSKYDVIACGCGMGQSELSAKRLVAVLKSRCKLVLDADALNLIAKEGLVSSIPAGSIITPHVGEFERLTGVCKDKSERETKAASLARTQGIFVVLKGHRTKLFTPEGKVWTNTTGNAGMATAGSGDVLCGVISSLLAQKYDAETAATLGVFLHGLAGDIAAKKNGQEFVTALTIVNCLGKAFKKIYTK